MLNVAKGGMPPAAERIIDTPISAIPGGLNRRDDQARLNLIADNQRNQLRREELLLSSWTSVISLRGTAIRCRENRFLTLRGTSSSVHGPHGDYYISSKLRKLFTETRDA
jgi:hypothetical protein